MNDRLDILVPWEGPVYAPVIAVERPLAFAQLCVPLARSPTLAYRCLSLSLSSPSPSLPLFLYLRPLPFL